MSRKKIKDWKMASFSLDATTIPKLDEIANFEGISKAQMVDFLVNNYSAGLDPSEKLKQLQLEKEEIQKKLLKVENEINQSIKQISLFNDWNKTKTNRKGDAIRILQRKLLEKDFESAEKVARTWSGLVGVPAMELLLEAKDKLDRKGI